MKPLIKDKENELQLYCIQYGVDKLYLFGSFARGNMSVDSDIDLLVSFIPNISRDYFDNYMSFKENLERLYHRKVDLLEVQAIRNPILKKIIDRDKIVMYERGHS